MFIESVCVCNFFQLMYKIFQLKNLKKLVIKECIFEAEENPTEIPIKLSLDSLVLHSNRMFQNQLNYLLSSIINLINFDYCFLQSDLYENENENFIVRFLCNPEFSSSIKELNLYSIQNGFNSLFNCNHLNLNKFSFNCFLPKVNLNTLESFLNKQTNLIYLGINFNPNNFSKLFLIMKSLCSRLQTIKYISFSFGFLDNIQNLNDLDFIWKLKGIKLRTPLPKYFESLKTESKLEELHLFTVNLEDIYDRFNFLPNLTCLILYNTCLNNNVYQAIFQHLLQLRKLCIFDSFENAVTDFGITGQTTGEYSITRLKKIETIFINDKQNITDLSLKYFSELTSLKKLLLGGTKVSSLSFNK